MTTETKKTSLVIDILDRIYSTHALARALSTRPCSFEHARILRRLRVEQLVELVDNAHDPSFVLSYGAAS